MSEYSVVIDYRERGLIELLKDKLIYSIENLAIGDVVFKKNDTIEFCLERKTIADLASSIKDGRYQEQAQRILECVNPNRCCYLIEGKIPNIEKYSNLNTKCLYGTIINKMFRDGIFVYRTNNIEETAYFITELANRYLTGKLEFTHDQINNEETKGNLKYVQKPRKKGDLDLIDCFSIQLASIPSISNIKIMALQKHFSSIRDFILCLEKQENPEKYLENITLNNGRKLGKSSANKILTFMGFKID